MLRPLDAAEQAAAKRWLSAPAQNDASSDGRFTARPVSGDTVELSTPDGPRRVKTRGITVEEASVSDDGKICAVAGKSRNHPVLAVVDDRGLSVLLDDGLSVHSPDLSADGKTVAAARCYDVVTVDGSGVHELAKLPHWVDRVEYLPGGRLLAETGFDVWAAGRVPMLFVVEPDGQFEAVTDVRAAEALGLDVRTPLLKGVAAGFHGASPQQCADLIDRFGYDTPSFRILSPDQRRMVFQMNPKHAPLPAGAEGTWILDAGAGAPRQIHAPSDTALLGKRRLSEAEWSGKGTRAALLFSGTAAERDVLAVAEGDGSLVTPLPLDFVRDGKPAMAWSPSERYLAFHVRNGDDVILYCFDADTGRFYPVAPKARLRGWDGERMDVGLPDGTQAQLSPSPLPVDQSIGVGLGGDLPRPPGTVVVQDDHVVINGVRVPRRA